MKKYLFTLLFVGLLSLSNAQTIEASSFSCNVQVAYAISEADGFGEYSVTQFFPLVAEKELELNKREFKMRRIYSKVNFDEMFIIRFETSGITHFVDARAADGFERLLLGGCSVDERPFISKDGSFRLDASLN